MTFHVIIPIRAGGSEYAAVWLLCGEELILVCLHTHPIHTKSKYNRRKLECVGKITLYTSCNRSIFMTLSSYANLSLNLPKICTDSPILVAQK